MVYRIFWLLLITTTLLMFPVHAQDRLKNLEFKQFSTPDGLPNSMVHQVYQDRDGYIWIPTFYGLFRYDGYEVRTYKLSLIHIYSSLRHSKRFHDTLLRGFERLYNRQAMLIDFSLWV